jgi:putative spermidine/putrescine transport system permease protein
MAAEAAARPPGQRLAWLFLAPLCVLMLCGYVLPLVETMMNSLHPNGPEGIDRGSWTLQNYVRLIDPLLGMVLVRTLRISLIVTALTALLAYPVAMFIARQKPRLQAWLILAYVSPWLVNTVVKSFGWMLLLRNNGVINTLLLQSGLVGRPLRLMLNETGVIIALLPGHFLFVLLPLWAAIGGIDPALRWAAGTLGATPRAVFFRVILPLTLPALLAGLVINFIMNLTAFAAPMLLGGARTQVLSMLAYQINLVLLDWPFGGAFAVALLAFTLALVWAGQRLAAALFRQQGTRP